MTSLPFASLVTLLAVLLMFATLANVSTRRRIHGIKPPAMTGHVMFERAVRIQMNTIESVLIFLPALWLFAGFIDDRWAGIMGGIWIVARVWYAWAYQYDPPKRSIGMGLSGLPILVLWFGALWGVVRTMM